MSESGLRKTLKALSVLGSVDGRVPGGIGADYLDGVLVLDTPVPYPPGALVEIFLGKAGIQRGVEVLGRVHTERQRLVIKPIIQVDTLADVGALKDGHLPKLPDELMDPGNLFEMVRRLQRLPTLPAAVGRILELTVDEMTTASDLAEVISQDPVLSAELLRLANSTYYGLEQQVATVDRAIVVLGFNRVRMAALTISVLRMWARSEEHTDSSFLPGIHFDECSFWQHCLGVAGASEALARSFGIFAGENAFVAGLFHDVGKIVLSQYLSPIFSRALIECRHSDSTIHSAEMRTSGLGHERIGEWLTSSWHLPLFIRQAIELHHLPELAGGGEMAPVIVHLADILARALGLGSGGDDLVPSPHATTWNRLDLSEERFSPAVEAFYRQIVNSKVFFSMMVGGGMPEAIEVLSEGGGKSAHALALAEKILAKKVEEESAETATVLKSMVKVLAKGGWLNE